MDNGTAFNISGLLDYDIFKFLTAAAGVEFNHNDEFSKDFRGTFELRFRYDYFYKR